MVPVAAIDNVGDGADTEGKILEALLLLCEGGMGTELRRNGAMLLGQVAGGVSWEIEALRLLLDA